MGDYRRLSLGVDIGGTNSAFGVVDSDGRVLAEGGIPTIGHPSAADFAAALAAEVRRICAESKIEMGSICGAGIGAPCVNASSGEIEAATDLPWPSPIPLRQLMASALGMPVAVANDANAAAAGEGLYGAARGMQNYIVLTLGTGVGAGVVVDGHLLSGFRGFAGELGHIPISSDPRRSCGCGRSGCLQTFCSAKGVVNTARILLEDNPDLAAKSALAAIADNELTALRISQEARKGDRLALETFRLTGEILGQACADFAAFADPEGIILFGGLAQSADLFLPTAEESFRRHALHLYRDSVRFAISTLPGSTAAILGAAALTPTPGTQFS